MRIWKLIGAFVVDGVLFIAVVAVLSRCGLIPELDFQAKLVLAVAWIGLGFKIFFGDIVSGKFLYHKHGHDFCLATMGAALSLFGLQMLSDKDLLPKISAATVWSAAPRSVEEAIRRTNGVLGAVFIATCLLTLLTASVSREIEVPATKWKNVLSAINFAIGTGALAAYLLLLLGK